MGLYTQFWSLWTLIFRLGIFAHPNSFCGFLVHFLVKPGFPVHFLYNLGNQTVNAFLAAALARVMRVAVPIPAVASASVFHSAAGGGSVGHLS